MRAASPFPAAFGPVRPTTRGARRGASGSVKRYADLATEIGAAAATYREEVRARAFPTAEQTYRPKS